MYTTEIYNNISYEHLQRFAYFSFFVISLRLRGAAYFCFASVLFLVTKIFKQTFFKKSRAHNSRFSSPQSLAIKLQFDALQCAMHFALLGEIIFISKHPRSHFFAVAKERVAEPLVVENNMAVSTTAFLVLGRLSPV